MKIPGRMEEPVSRKELIQYLLAMVGVIVLVAGGAVARADIAGKEAAAEARAAVESLKAEVASNKHEADAGNAEVRKDIQAVYNFLLTKKPQERLEKPK